MYFNKVLGIEDFNICDEKIFYRKAIRAVILRDDKILMVKLKTGDYKFPGGGVEEGESVEETLIREVKEETGYIVKSIGEKIGTVIERDRREKIGYSLFEMTSEYYLCKVNDEKFDLNLDDYEKDLGFEPVWISLEKAINENKYIIDNYSDSMNPWVRRETFALNNILNFGIEKLFK